MSQLTAFVGVTGLVLSGFLVLARLSQRVVDDVEDAEHDAPTEAARPTPTQRPQRDVESLESTSETATGDDRPDTGHGIDDDSPSTAERPDRSREQTRPDEAVESYDMGGDAPAVDAATTDSGTESASPGRQPSETRVNPTGPDGDPTGSGVDEEYEPALARAEPGVETMSPGMLLANVALTQGLFGGILAAAAWYFQVPGDVLGLWGGSVAGMRAVAVGVAFGVVLWIGNELASAFADAAGATYDEGLREMLAPANARGWALLLGATLPIIALVEEFLFRAAAIGAASAALPVSPWVLAVISSAGFALGHGAQGRVGVVVTGALGMILAAGYVLTGSFVVVVVAHYLVNALEFGLHEGLGLPDPIWS